jgi:hypothetical protein
VPEENLGHNNHHAVAQHDFAQEGNVPAGGNDEDEWVSSESGAATPSPAGRQKIVDLDATAVNDIVNAMIRRVPPPQELNGNEVRPQPESPPFPTATMPTRAPPTVTVETPSPQPQLPQQQAQESAPARPKFSRTASVPALTPLNPPTLNPDALKDPRFEQLAMPFQQGKSPQRTGRPLSIHAFTPLHPQPHPLIRAPSYHQYIANSTLSLSNTAPAPPKTTTASAEVTPVGSASNSPVLTEAEAGVPHALHTSPVGSPGSSGGGLHALMRRPSASSIHSHYSTTSTTIPIRSPRGSVHTLPHQQTALPNDKRQRTQSALSTHSLSQALSNLASADRSSRPASPPLTTYFPSASFLAEAEEIHPLLPQPYLGTHVSVTRFRSPLAESWDRVYRGRPSANVGVKAR